MPVTFARAFPSCISIQAEPIKNIIVVIAAIYWTTSGHARSAFAPNATPIAINTQEQAIEMYAAKNENRALSGAVMMHSSWQSVTPKLNGEEEPKQYASRQGKQAPTCPSCNYSI